MKKTYITPASQVAAFYAEESLMVSMSDQKAAGSQALSDKKEFGGWDSESWSGEEE